MVDRIFIATTILAIGLFAFVFIKSTVADEPPASDVITANEQAPDNTTSQTKSSARATASASAKSSSGKGDCLSEASSSAYARAGDDYDQREDHDSAQDASDACEAEASSSAKATGK